MGTSKREYGQYIASLLEQAPALYEQLDRRAVTKEMQKKHSEEGLVPPFYYLVHLQLINEDYLTAARDPDITGERLEEMMNEAKGLAEWFGAKLAKEDKDAMIEHLKFNTHGFGTEEEMLNYHQKHLKLLQEKWTLGHSFAIRRAAYRLNKTSGRISAANLERVELPEKEEI